MNTWKGKKLAANFEPLEKQQLTKIKLFCSEKKTHKLFTNKLSYLKGKLVNKKGVTYFNENAKDIESIQLQK